MSVSLLFFLFLHLLCSSTTESPCPGSHAADICVQAGPTDMAFTSPRCVSLPCLPPTVILNPPCPFYQCACGFVCLCALGPSYAYSVCVFKPCPDHPHSDLFAACVHSRGHGMEQRLSVRCRMRNAVESVQGAER